MYYVGGDAREGRGDADEELVRLIERGGPDTGRAVATLFARNLPRVYSLCRRYFAVREDAEEAASETFLRAFRALAAGQFRGASQFRTWLLRIAGNTCLERLRQPRLPTLSLDGLIAREDESPVVQERRSDADERVLEAIRRLPDDQSLAITLCDLEGYTAREAAEVMRRSPEAMKSLHYRARRALRDILTDWQREDRKLTG